MKNKIRYILKKAIKVTCFLTIASILTVTLSYSLRPDHDGKNMLAQYYTIEDNTIDMVYIGGSAAYAFWEPMSAWKSNGYATTLFASGTLQPIAIKYCIKDVLKSQNPKLLLIDLRPFQYGSDTSKEENFIGKKKHGIYGTIYKMDYSKNRIDAINAMVPKSANKFTYYFDVLSCHTSDSLEKLFSEPLLAINRYDDPYKGFLFKKAYSKQHFTDYSHITEKEKISEDLIPILTDLLEYLKTTDKQVLFVVHSYCITEEHQKKYNYLKEVINQNGFDFLNCNDYYNETGLDYSTDYYDPDHVNIFGADKYTKFLTDYISEHYDLPDHRLDSAYDSWNNDYEIFAAAHESNENIIRNLIKKSNEE